MCWQQKSRKSDETAMMKSFCEFVFPFHYFASILLHNRLVADLGVLWINSSKYCECGLST